MTAAPHPHPDTLLFWAGQHHERHEHHERHDRHTLLGTPTAEGSVQWDAAEELAYQLQEAAGAIQAEPLDRIVFDEPADPVGPAVAGLGVGVGVGVGTGAGMGAGGMGAGMGMAPSATGEWPHPPAHASHRRPTSGTSAVTLLRTGSLLTSVLVAVIAAVVSLFSGMAICDALRHSAGPRTAHDVVSWWPLLIYGPWVVASLSILRAALHQRRAIHSWSIVLLFSTLATLLCLAQAPRTLAGQAAATLPPIAALACFQQLVRQITLTRPPRQPSPRHRNSRSTRTPAPMPQPAAVPRQGATGLPDFALADRGGSMPPAPGRRFRYGS
ncbi:MULTISPECIES: DUF2637 domain-containing protein [Streptomyces]|jgi:hypothetical protein|uniref:DUF2637 domain-containing protein n=1 Tax=Streptomyces TaxID=1883 RepID=UPI002F956176